jgi:hypothetical protein
MEEVNKKPGLVKEPGVTKWGVFSLPISAIKW